MTIDGYKRSILILVFISLSLGILLLCSGFFLSSKVIGPKMALLVSPDGHITPDGLEMLKDAGVRLRFLGLLMLSCSFLLFGIILFLPSFLTKFFKSSIRRKFVDCVFGIRWDVVLGIIGITYLCLMLIIGVMFSPFSNDESLRLNGAKQFITTGNTFPLDAVGSPIDVSEGMPLPPYLPAILCVALGGGHASPKALYAVFCLFCIIALGYVTYKTFGKRAIGFTVFFASMLPFVHQYAVDAARTEMLATLVLLIGVVLLYQRTYKSRWIQILACFAIGLSFQFKITLIVLIPAFVITGLISGVSKEWRSRALTIIMGPIIAIAAFWIL
ncbi:glycosyltransferase family 39 protein, partial [bacterium]|nr:glycosyltransferase family 39 protein [bacterium]